MDQGSNKAQREDDEEIASARYPTSARLVAAILCADEAAIRELFLLYAPLLRDQARRMTIPIDERDELVTTVLDDVVLHLLERQIAPRNFSRYLVASLRNRARNWHRDSHRRLDVRERGYDEPATSPQRIVAECHSEYGMHASGRLDGDATHPIRGSISRLAQMLTADLSRDETVMLICVGRHVPLREIAGQVGVSYGTARVRLHRLRERFRKRAMEHLRSLKPDERMELEKFFRRAGVNLSRPAATRQEKDHGKV